MQLQLYMDMHIDMHVQVQRNRFPVREIKNSLHNAANSRREELRSHDVRTTQDGSTRWKKGILDSSECKFCFCTTKNRRAADIGNGAREVMTSLTVGRSSKTFQERERKRERELFRIVCHAGTKKRCSFSATFLRFVMVTAFSGN